MSELSIKKKSSLAERFNNSIVILFSILAFIALLSYVIPAGEYDRVQVGGQLLTKAGSFHTIPSSPMTFMGFFQAVPQGMQAASSLLFMILLIGGSIRIFDSTGAIRSALGSLINVFGKDKGGWILASIVIFFALIGAFPAMFEATIPFAPICVSIALALGYDVVVGVAIGLLGVAVGWTAGPTNPWTVGIGHNIAQLPLFSGFSYRLFVLIVLVAITIVYILRYGNAVKSGRRKSVMEGIDISEFDAYKSLGDDIFTVRHKLIILTLAITIGVLLYGTYNWHWQITEMSAIYILGGIIAGLIGGFSPGKIADEFIDGGKAIFMPAMAVGLARSIQIIMNNTHITDTLVYYFSIPLQGLSPAISAVGMFIVQSLLTFFIPSGSGLAMLSMPIMVPLSDVIHLNRQIAILAFQYGDGLAHLCFPTTAVTVAFIAVGKIPFSRWLKFIMPYLYLVWAFAAISLVIAVAVNWS
ncbi:YfcC family protein [Sporomusa acidovorans]|uniref:C4-dicarboxylate anaerobic carrier n=1 Tax=Sporomusa acidovorans (strain ATCC 49682 / DSM 3132 / Mol) TaxID=1123286 RepID=A0ABZ3J966_SPOA4|nr:YfcC family protein [Sporomusa acidovorans]OZC16075.1 hypothetical protein SPACI_44420 [Sporomusa acidovorans DSM 3132]SDD87570.1 Uncharacterized membrane protein YfcC, ion transporter superfamily [Sporomusa acidovorans]